MPVQSVNSKPSSVKARSNHAPTATQGRPRKGETEKKDQQVNRDKGSVPARAPQAQAKKAAAHNPSAQRSGQQAAHAATGNLILSTPTKGPIYGQSTSPLAPKSIQCDPFELYRWSNGGGNIVCRKNYDSSSVRLLDAQRRNEPLNGRILDFSGGPTNSNLGNYTVYNAYRGKVTNFQSSTPTSKERVDIQFGTLQPLS